MPRRVLWGVIAGGLALVGVVVAIATRAAPGRPAPRGRAFAAGAAAAPSPDPPRAPSAPPPAGSIPGETAPEPAAGAPTRPSVTFSPDRALVRINGVAVLGRQLAPAKGGAAVTLSPEMYAFLLDRAITRELVTQAAHARGVALSPSDKQRLEDLRTQAAKREAEVLSDSRSDPAQIEFDVLDASGLMLQNALLTHAGHWPDVTVDDVQRYYREHDSELPPLPADPAARDAVMAAFEARIRGRLAPIKQRAYQQAAVALVAELKAAARIDPLGAE